MTTWLSVQAVIGWIVLPATVFATVYQPILTRLSLGLLSPYGKADVRKRIVAALLDAFIVISPSFAAITSGNWSYAAIGAAYALFRDGFGGHSVGKLVMGLVVVNVETGLPASWTDSGRRNILFLLPGANLAAVILETRTLMRDPQGQRLGDRFAQTQVVEGSTAAELVKHIETALLHWTGALGEAAHRPPRESVREDRVA